MTKRIRLFILVEALIHQIGPAVQDVAQLGVLIGFFIIGIISMPLVIVLNLLTKFLSAIADRDE